MQTVDPMERLILIAERIADKLHVIYVPTWERFMKYSNGIYVEIDDEAVRLKARQALAVEKKANPKVRVNTHSVNEIMAHIRDTRSHGPTDFDADRGRIINFTNGLYDRRTGRRGPHDPDYLSIRQVQTKYVEDAECPYIRGLFSQWVAPEDVDKLGEVLAWCLDNEYDVEAFVYLLGRGSNGKGTFTTILTEVLGPENVSGVSMQAMNRDKFAASGMYGKIANISNETSGVIDDNSRLMELTGGDMTQWERKFGHPWTDKNYTKQVFAGMSLPSIKSGVVSDGTGRRFEPIFFPNRFDGSVPKSEIIAKARKEYPGLVAWALRLLPGLKERNHFNNGMSIDEKVELYRLISDGVYLFSKFFTRDEGTYIEKQSLYVSYLELCTAYGLVTVGEYQFYRQFQRHLPMREARVPPSLSNEKVHAFKGISRLESGPQDRLSLLSCQLLQRKEYNVILEEYSVKSGKSVSPTSEDWTANRARDPAIAKAILRQAAEKKSDHPPGGYGTFVGDGKGGVKKEGSP
ncbi:MAG TPA: phage/plasmid primase, P4 family [Thermoplasmata archaeon]|nr:phage/plasmid primase, P4 family [Thermoplasmata archaeon]